MRVLGSGVTTTVVGLGTVTVGEATVGAKQYRNKVIDVLVVAILTHPSTLLTDHL